MFDLHSISHLNGRTGRALIHSATVYPLASNLPATTQGRKRPFSLENALELTFRCTLLDYGLNADSSAELAKDFLAAYERDALENTPYCVLNLSRRRLAMPSGGLATPVAVLFGKSDTRLKSIQEYAPDWTLEDENHEPFNGQIRKARGGAALLVIDLAEIAERVKALEGAADG